MLHKGHKDFQDDWMRISADISTKTDLNCRYRWKQVNSESSLERFWSEEEDSLLRRLIIEHSKDSEKQKSIPYAKIAMSMHKRNGKQLRNRWIFLAKSTRLLSFEEYRIVLTAIQKHQCDSWDLVAGEIVAGDYTGESIEKHFRSVVQPQATVYMNSLVTCSSEDRSADFGEWSHQQCPYSCWFTAFLSQTSGSCPWI